MATRRRINRERTRFLPDVAAVGVLSQGPDLDDLSWLENHGAELMEKYRGKWIAVDAGELIAHANSLAEVRQLAAEKRHPTALVTKLPDTPVEHLCV